MAAKPFPIAIFILFLIGGVATGFNGIFMRLANEINPIASAFWRFAMAAPLLWAWALAVEKEDRAAGRRLSLSRSAFLTGFYFAANVGVLHLSLHFTTVSDASLLLNFSSVFIAIWMWKIHHTRFAPIFIVGMGMALVGAFLLIGISFGMTGTRLLGDIFGICAAVLYAAYQLLVKAARVRYSGARLMAWASTVSAITMLPFALMYPGKFVPELSETWVALILLTLVGQILGHATIAWCSAHLPVALSSLSLAVMPLTATIAAWIMFNEALGMTQLVGGTLILLGILLSTRGYHHHNPPG